LTDVIEYESRHDILISKLDPELPEIIDELIKIAKSDPAQGIYPSKIKLEAIRYILDRLYGKPASEIVQRQEGNVNVTVTRVESRSREEFKQIMESKLDYVDGVVNPGR
jgi:hypothetical protein